MKHVFNFSSLLFLQRMAQWSSQHSGKFPDPYAKLKLDHEKNKEKKKKKKKEKKKQREKELREAAAAAAGTTPVSGADGRAVPNSNKVGRILFYAHLH